VTHVATDQQTDQAITAVRNNQATKDQEEIARRAAQQAGSRGNRARDAFKGK
jgi:hypothetical protein